MVVVVVVVMVMMMVVVMMMMMTTTMRRDAAAAVDLHILESPALESEQPQLALAARLVVLIGHFAQAAQRVHHLHTRITHALPPATGAGGGGGRGGGLYLASRPLCAHEGIPAAAVSHAPFAATHTHGPVWCVHGGPLQGLRKVYCQQEPVVCWYLCVAHR